MPGDSIVVVQIQGGHDLVGDVGNALRLFVQSVESEERANDVKHFLIVDRAVAVAIVGVVEPVEFLLRTALVAVNVNGDEKLVELDQIVLGQMIEGAKDQIGIVRRAGRLQQLLVEVVKIALRQPSRRTTFEEQSMVISNLFTREFRPLDQIVELSGRQIFPMDRRGQRGEMIFL